MSSKRTLHKIVELNSKYLVVTGGYYGSSMSDCELYNMEEDEWTLLPQLNNARHKHMSCAFEKKWIYVYSGGFYEEGWNKRK